MTKDDDTRPLANDQAQRQQEWPTVFDEALSELARLRAEQSLALNNAHTTGAEEISAATELATQGLLFLQALLGGAALSQGQQERLLVATAALVDVPAHRAEELMMALNAARAALEAGKLEDPDLEWVIVAARRHVNASAPWVPTTEADQRIALEAVQGWTISKGGKKDRGNKTEAYAALLKRVGGETHSDEAGMKNLRRVAKRVKHGGKERKG